MKIRRIGCALALLLFILLTLASPRSRNAATPAPPRRARVFVLGTFHMANPGRDIFNLKVDDVLAPKRQKELVELASLLKKFQPTKIALETKLEGPRPKQYQEYLAGNLTLTRNEIHQVGFRLAKELGHKQIYPIDADGDFPFDAITQFARKTGKEARLNELNSQFPKDIEVMSGILNRGTITDLLRYLNTEEHIKRDQQYYMSLAQFAGEGQFPGPDLLTAWYQRNIRIFSNLRGIIDSPDDRVLVIYGAGHLFWLQRNIMDSPDLELVRLSDYVK
jgi:hypothetical protein